MKKTHRKRSNSIGKIAISALLVGLVLMTGSYTVCTVLERNEGSRSAQEALSFLKVQCLRYDNMTAAEDTDEQIQLLDKAVELRRCLENDTIEADFLESYAKNQRLTGIILLDANQEKLESVSLEEQDETAAYDDWDTLLQDSNITDVLQYPQKVYLSHLKTDTGSVYNYVAIARQNGEGLVFCYVHQNGNSLSVNKFSIEKLLSGYTMKMDGTLLVTDGNKIIASNQESLIDQSTEDCELIIQGNESISTNKMSTVHEKSGTYLVRAGKCRDYYLYVCFPTKSVFRQRPAIMAYMLILYITLLLIFSIIKQQENNRTNHLKMEFLHQMSHDIRTPINGIRGMIRIGDHYAEDVEKQKECRGKIWEASTLLLDLVSDVLDMGKLESGEMKLEKKSFQLQELMQNIASVMENQAKSQGVTLQLSDMTGTHWNLIGSPVQVRRILVNILSNAIKYNHEKGFVYLSCQEIAQDTESGKTAFTFICTDTGIGMSREFQKHMFEQFTQEKATEELPHHGTGLGLAIVKSLVQEMQGTIACDSKIGEGTTFRITIPFEIDTIPVAPPSNDNADYANKTLHGITVLLVEDNDINMEVAEFLLREEGATVVQARNGQEAVDIFADSAANEIQVILMDMMMPVMDGETASRTIRNLDRSDAQTVPIIAMTANAFEEDIQTALAAGMNAHLAKPVDPEQIKKAILQQIAAVG